MWRLPFLGCAVAVLGLLVPTGAVADPIRVVAGEVYLSSETGFGLGRADVSGPGFSVGGSATTGAGWCYPCVDGETVNLSASFHIGSGGGTYLGHEFEIDMWGGGANIQITVADFVLPIGPSSGPRTLTMPFTAWGGFYTGHPDFPGADFYGAGTLTATFRTRDAGDGYPPGTTFWSAAELSYLFEDQGAAPVPEPATLLLLGTGLAGTLVRYRRRHEKQTDPR